eukprot:CCRYP_006432-RC/>CCRYP_006432-RC protein AED:0.31 eAED:0.30 QI:0/-1/0/1/-1/1/1/0/185
MIQNQKASDFFSPLQYVLCDTAFEPSDIAVAAYKCQAGFVQDRDEQMFSTCMSSPRVITAHTMGLWKGRFPWLRNIRMLITDDTESLERILKYIDVAVVLHNMLIDFGGEDEVDGPWDVDDEVLSDLDDATRIPERNVLEFPIPVGSLPGTRREQLKALVREKFNRQYNFQPRHNESSCNSEDSE